MQKLLSLAVISLFVASMGCAHRSHKDCGGGSGECGMKKPAACACGKEGECAMMDKKAAPAAEATPAAKPAAAPNKK